MEEETKEVALLTAVLDGDEAAVARLLGEGADPNAAPSFEDTPLVTAVAVTAPPASEDATLGIVRLLVGAGANLEVTNAATGSTPLVLAVSGKLHETARFLIERGAQVNVAGDVSDVYGRQSPLILAVQTGDLELVRLLLARGADPNRFGEFHGRPLHYAARDEHLGAIDLLFDHGADPWFRDGDCGYTALELALLRKQWEAARALYQRMDAREPNCLGTPLHALATRGAAPSVKALLDAGTSVDVRDGAGKTALHWAVGGPRPLSKLILEAAGQPVPSRVTGRPSVVELLLRRGAELDAVDLSGDTPLHDATAWGGEQQLRLASQLIGAGADVRKRDQTGWTPLLLAARAAAPPELVDQLLGAGADPGDRQRQWGVLTFAAHAGGLEAVRALIEHGVPTNASGNAPGWSPLHAAARMGHEEVVKLLLASGADRLAVDDDGKTPAEWASSAGIAALLKA